MLHKAPAKTGTQYFNYIWIFFFVFAISSLFIADKYSQDRQDVPYVIGYQVYPAKTFLLRPCPDSEDPDKLHFNELLSITKRCVECAFGILVAKWRCFKNRITGNSRACYVIVYNPKKHVCYTIFEWNFKNHHQIYFKHKGFRYQ